MAGRTFRGVGVGGEGSAFLRVISVGYWEKNPLKGKRLKKKSLSRVRLFATRWTVAYQAPQSMGFSRKEYWSWLPFPSPGDLPGPGIKPESPALQADYLLSHQGSPQYLK